MLPASLLSRSLHATVHAGSSAMDPKDLEQPAPGGVPAAEPLACIRLADHSTLVSVSLVALSRTVPSTS